MHVYISLLLTSVCLIPGDILIPHSSPLGWTGCLDCLARKIIPMLSTNLSLNRSCRLDRTSSLNQSVFSPAPSFLVVRDCVLLSDWLVFTTMWKLHIAVVSIQKGLTICTTSAHSVIPHDHPHPHTRPSLTITHIHTLTHPSSTHLLIPHTHSPPASPI